MRSRLRFIIAISLAVVLGAWLAWTSLGGSLETYAGPGELAAVTDSTYRLNGRVAEGAPTDAAARAQSAEGLRFTVVDKEDPAQKVAVLYRGTVPDQFKAGREVVVTGRRRGRHLRGPQRLADHPLPVQVHRPARRHRGLSRRPRPVVALCGAPVRRP